ncbi:PLP-dependent aminotransferase family protein [Pseudomonas entomophila]|uniref:MocR-like pyridoxine biosynthesis transcription factor PdxR n=1 Tax=Pseudomonas entomophila TaxID=312306 RepID=UPI0015E368A5|nr:PLP-dependent aminotransferase family protein [Pseudomonas entomophila]MBA1189166.1 PLP-dependent aminotransferase family protein [Pseudomonas entomophila]
MPPPSVSLPFDPAGLVFDGRQALARQLYQALRQRMLDGRLSTGTRMPASRVLATALGVSRNTVVRAYDQLQAEGFIAGHVGDGTYVEALTHVSTDLSTDLPPGISTGLSTNVAPDTGQPSSQFGFADASKRLASPVLALPPGTPPKAFRVGVPAFDLFPFKVWSALQAGFWRHPDPALLGYGDPAGDPGLRELIAAYLRGSRGLTCTADQILITQGAQEAITLCAQLLVPHAGCVAVENPGYRAAGHAFAANGCQVAGIPVDKDGLCVERLTALEGCQAVYVTPAHQYPTGVTLSLARRLALLEWAERVGGWVIEDDYDGEYRYSGAPLAPLAALDRQQRVVYIGTFGKIAFPALRLGYLVLPRHLVASFVQRRALAVRHSEVGTQQVMARFIADGHFQRHIRRMRRAALSRRNVLKAGWPTDIPGLAAMPAVVAGLHVKVDVESLALEQALVASARTAGVEINPLSDYWTGPVETAEDRPTGLVLGFAAVPEPAIAEATMRLRKAWRAGRTPGAQA